MKRLSAISAGVFAGMLLLSTPGWPQSNSQGAVQTPQAAPSPKPVPQAQLGHEAPMAVGAVPTPGPNVVGNQQAAPSPVPASKATPEAVESRQTK
jgi:hypothetical protein